MTTQTPWRRLLAAVEREYERRIRAASLVTEYGAQHAVHEDADDGEAAVIANVPRGTRLGGRSTHEAPPR